MRQWTGAGKTEAFGEAVQEVVQSAHSRIWILAYYISGGSHETIQAIYNTVRQKARTGLDALVISEFGKGTPMPIRNATLNYAQTLEADGKRGQFHILILCSAFISSKRESERGSVSYYNNYVDVGVDSRWDRGMARKPRLEYEGAVYHMMNRGNRWQTIFRTDEDRRCFLDALGEVCKRTGLSFSAWPKTLESSRKGQWGYDACEGIKNIDL